MAKGLGSFSLVELMAALAIIAIIAIASIPPYQNYVARTKIADAFTVIEKIAIMAEEYYLNNGKFPDAGQLGIGSGYWVNNASTYGPYVARMDVFNDWRTPVGCMVGINVILSGSSLGVTFANTQAWSTDSGTLTNIIIIDMFMIANDNGGITRVCGIRGDSSADLKYLPPSCQTYFGTGSTLAPSSATCT